MTEALRAGLQAYAEENLAGLWPGPAVGPLRRLTDGWESELYAFDVAHGRRGEPRQRARLVLRLYLGEGAGRKARHEFTAMRRLAQAGFPVPGVHHLVVEAGVLGKPFILMDWVEGVPLWPGLEQMAPPQQEAALRRYSALLAELHALDWRPFAADPAALEAAGPFVFADAMLAEAGAFVEGMGLAGFVPVVAWLREQREQAACTRPAVTHRDYHPANVLARADGALVVIDWPNLAVTDARFDLAWTLMLAETYAGEGLRRAVLAGYEQASGAAAQNLAYFEAQACARRLADVVVSLTLGPERMGMRPEAAALMRAQLPAVRATADLLASRTGLRVPEVERLLAEADAATA